MNAPLRRIWTQQEFFAWHGHGEGRYEFDGTEPVAMTAGTFVHNQIMQRIYRVLDQALAGTGCRVAGPDAGLATVGNTVRDPDALVTNAIAIPPTALTVPGMVACFEVASPGSVRLDRIVKVREYAAVPTVLHYVILEPVTVGLTVFGRTAGTDGWSARTLTEEDTLHLPGLGITLPVAALYEGIELPPEEASDR